MKVCGQNRFARLLPQRAITIQVLSAKPKNALFSLQPSVGTQTFSGLLGIPIKSPSLLRQRNVHGIKPGNV